MAFSPHHVKSARIGGKPRWRRAFVEYCPLQRRVRLRIASVAVFLGIGLGGFSTGCSRSQPEAPALVAAHSAWFRDVTDEVGLKFVHDPGPVGSYPMYQIIGSGAAFLDFDNDGRMDIYLLNNGGPKGRPNQLYRQRPDGAFENVSKGSGLDFAGHCMGVAVGDINNDGWPDVLVTQYSSLRLFRNNGNGTFTDITKEAGLDSPLWGTSASFLDYDRDGWLDLVVVNYADYDPGVACYHKGGQNDYCHPRQFRGSVTKLYRNRGLKEKSSAATAADSRPVRFDDVTLSAGLGRLAAYGLGVLCADFDGDGWPDIFVASDSDANHLWINQRNGTFAEEAAQRSLAYDGQGRALANMGVAWGDIDNDGLAEIFVTHLTEETHTLWSQRPPGIFRDITIAAGITKSHGRGTGFGTVLVDFDHDGALDLALVNGRVARARSPAPQIESPWSWYAEHNQILANDGAGHFIDVSQASPAFSEQAGVGRGLAYADFDGDGAIDLLVTSVAGPARLFKNVAPKHGHWLRVRALDPTLKRDAYGATIVVRSGKQRWKRWLLPASSYLCSNEPWVHVGLGAVERLDAIEVQWPDGKAETFPGGAVDRDVLLRRGEGQGSTRK